LNRPRQQHQYNNVIDAPVGHDTAASNVELALLWQIFREHGILGHAAARTAALGGLSMPACGVPTSAIKRESNYRELPDTDFSEPR
jgi:hypothetical protein